MTATRKERIGAVERLARVFGHPTHWTGASLEEYIGALDDLTAGELHTAVAVLRRHHRAFLPTPAQIREAAGKPLVEPDGGIKGWASRCGYCGADLSFPDSRRLGVCGGCRGAVLP